MKILYLHQYFNTPAMSGGTRSFEMARRLVDAGHEVNLITSRRDSINSDGWEVTLEAGIRVHWYPVPYSNNMGFLKRIVAFIRFAVAATQKAKTLNADIVFATSTPLTIVLPGLLTAWRKRLPLVFEVRDMWPAVPIALGYLKNPMLQILARWMETIAYRFSHSVVALAPGMRDDIIATGISRNKITVIPNGCDLDIFGADLTALAKSIRSSHFWLQNRKLVLFAGTLGRANGLGYLVQIVSEMRKIDSEVRFVVIGDGAEKSRTTELASQLGVLGTSFHMLGSMPKNELAGWMAACDFSVCLFSGPRVLWKDAVQNKFFDSISAGKPVACNFKGFQSEISLERDVGIILSTNPKEAAIQLYEKLNDLEWLSGVPSRAIELAKNDFNRDYLARKLEDVLLNAISARKS